MIVDTGALSDLEEAINGRLQRAVESLDDRINSAAVGPLTELAAFIVDRAS